jgi:hypothetical protein
MSRVEVLKAAGSGASVKFLELTRIQAKHPNAVVCIFEGEDEKYYGCRLSVSYGNDGWRGINTGGRSAVLELRSSIIKHPLYNKCKFLCFIDKDYEDWYVNPDPERIYVTPCYSVENLYANEICLDRLLSAEFKVTDFNEFSAEHKICLEAFINRMNEACAHLLEFNSWAKSRSIMARDKKPPIKIHLSNAHADDLITLNLIKCEIKYNPDNVSSVFKKLNNNMLDQPALAEARLSLSEGQPIYDYRGKQQLQAFNEFIKSLQADFTKPGNIIFNKKNKLKIDFENENIDLLSTLSQYAKTPDCLRAFLNRSVVAYTQN